LSGRTNTSATIFALEPSIAVVSRPNSPEIKPDTAATYLEVGSFGDSQWADNAVDQLSKLGFPAICVHKSHLWVQSYHVQVGPYQTGADVEAAKGKLAANGFESHPVK
jgi:cell division protein FtsN